MPCKFRDLFDLRRKLLYLAWRALGGRFPLRLRMASGLLLNMRPMRSRDYGTAYDVFALETYDPTPVMRREDYREIVDLGANVGYASLYFSERFPAAHIHAFEPHPLSFELLKENVRINGLDGRITLHCAAADVHEGQAYLTDDRTASSVTAESGQGRFPIKVRDIFSIIGEGPIDLLKMDIEGGEYPILADERFGQLPLRCLVMEWHNSSRYPDGRSWCTERLTSLGFQVEVRRDDGPTGILAAFREP